MVPPKPFFMVSVFSWPQLEHLIATDVDLIILLLAAVIIPGTTTNWPIRLLYRSLSILGFSSEVIWSWKEGSSNSSSSM